MASHNFDFRKVDFYTTALLPKDYPKQPIPEIAVVGRSNVGKSSLLNFLFGRKSLVKVSGVPGKTRTIQFFLVEEKLFVTDLPGYGYAKAPAHQQKKWSEALELYFENRPTLRFLLFLLDIRRDPSADDRALIEWAQHHDLSLLIVFTKTDKISRGKRKNRATSILHSLGMKEQPHVLTSTTEKLGRQELITMINRQLQE